MPKFSELWALALRRNKNSVALVTTTTLTILTFTSTFLFSYYLYQKDERDKPGNFKAVDAVSRPKLKCLSLIIFFSLSSNFFLHLSLSLSLPLSTFCL